MYLAGNDLITRGEAVSIEHTVSRILQCNRLGYGGLVNADLYIKNPLEAAIACTVFLLPAGTDDRVDGYISDFFFYWRNATVEQYRDNFYEEFISFVKKLEEYTPKS